MQAFLFLVFVSAVTANFHLDVVKKIAEAHTSLNTTAHQRRVVESVGTRTNAQCTVTNYNRRFWDQKGGTSTLLLGNWEGVGTLRLIHKPTATVLFTDSVVNTWNATFEAEGYIKWIDNFMPSSLPPSTGDTFLRYLQSDSEQWYCCTDLEGSLTAGSVDYELDVFGLPTSYSALVNSATGTHDAACTYHFESDTTVIVGCSYYDTLVNVLPPDVILQYYVYQRKVSV